MKPANKLTLDQNDHEIAQLVEILKTAIQLLKRPIRIVFYNFKGGVAKTTTVDEVGKLLRKAGVRVLFIDCDAQANLTETKFNVARPTYTIGDVIGENHVPISEAIIEIDENTSIVPSSDDLTEVVNWLTVEEWLDNEKRELLGLPTVKRKDRAIYNLDKATQSLTLEQAEVILFDPSPGADMLNFSVLTAADILIFPTQTEPESFAGLKKTWKAIEKAQRRNKNIAHALGWIATFVRLETKLHELNFGIVTNFAEEKELHYLGQTRPHYGKDQKEWFQYYYGEITIQLLKTVNTALGL
ncbi:MAG: AAA family ATPase [Chloroflexota bacterium]